MRTLAVRQPWATFIAEGTKTIEVRSWKTDFRGEVLIVASGRPFKAENIDGETEILPSQVQVCTVTLLDCRLIEETDLEGACCDICPGEEYAWVLANPRHVEPKPHKGKLNLYTTPDEEIEHFLADEHYLDHLDQPPAAEFLAVFIRTNSTPFFAASPRVQWPRRNFVPPI